MHWETKGNSMLKFVAFYATTMICLMAGEKPADQTDMGLWLSLLLLAIFLAIGAYAKARGLKDNPPKVKPIPIKKVHPKPSKEKPTPPPRSPVLSNDIFPWEDVEASRKENGRSRKAKKIARSFKGIVSCPSCGRESDQLSWFYFSSPPQTWEHMCGQAGWMAVCDHCHKQVMFDLEVMN